MVREDDPGPARGAFSYDEAFARHRGLISADEQARLRNARVAIVGMGGVGGIHLITLARLGIGAFHIADPDVFEIANFNRQYGATMRSVGLPKVEVMAAEALAINPELDIRTFREPIGPGNVADFLEGVDLLVDGIDFFALDVRRLLFREARARGIWGLTAGPIGFSAAYLTFSPTGMAFDDYFDLDDSMGRLEQLASFLIGLTPRATHRSYMDLTQVDTRSGRGPSAGLACHLCGGVAGAEAVKILLSRSPLRPRASFLPVRCLQADPRPGPHPLGQPQPLAAAQATARRLVAPADGLARMREAGRLDPTLRQILAAASSAPSGDNTQPVRFDVDPASRTIVLRIDPTRDPSPMNAGQRMARMAAGASIENIVRAAENLGLAASVEPGSGEPIAVVRLSGLDARATPGPALPTRVTNRKVYESRPVQAEVLDRLASETPPIGATTTHWITGTDRLAGFADLIGAADATMFGEPTMRAAFLAKVRFDEPPEAESAEGLPLNALEVGAADRLALRTMRRTPDWLLRVAGAGKVFAQKARALVVGSSGLCLVVAPDGSEASDLDTGRALQRAWLALGAEGLATQPMMSLLVLENLAENGDAALLATIGPARLEKLRARLRELAPEIAGRRPAWLQRFGHASAPTGRTGRLPVESVAEVRDRPLI